MGGLKLNSSTYQALAIGMPLMALALSLLVVYPSWGRYRALAGEVEDLEGKLQILKAAPLPPKDPVLTAADDVESEPPDFLRQVADLARSSGCEVQGLERIDGGEAKGPVRPIRTRVTLNGHYPRLRTFFWRAYRAPRLFAVTDLNISAGTATTVRADELLVRPLTATFVLERYVTKPPDAAAPAGSTPAS